MALQMWSLVKRSRNNLYVHKMSEIVSLQLGHYSNFVGAHRWNMQVSLHYQYGVQLITLQDCSRSHNFVMTHYLKKHEK